MIIHYYFDNRKYNFLQEKSVKSNKNIFTILIGKNGTGKSRLLSSVINSLLGTTVSASHRNPRFPEFEIGELVFDKMPESIIAVSTSPFDRFPFTKYRKPIKGYNYLGIRDLNTQNFGLSYMSKIAASLIAIIGREPKRMREITEVLKELGFTSRMTIKFHTRISAKIINSLTTSKNPFKDFENIITKERPAFFSFSRSFFENEDGSLSKQKITYLVKAFERIKTTNELSKGYSVVEINKDGLSAQYSFVEYIEDLIFFINSGIIRLNDVVLEKLNGGYFSINAASSGEQSSIVSILGIASKIQDNSLICIDEPEICLHPEWQERYIKLLVKTFNQYKRCHFIIATHSPQIVSNLTQGNSFILSMETGNVINANMFVQHSADFQLASLFNSPGFRNEFLSRIALSVFAKVAKNKIFENEDKRNYELLKAQSVFLRENDPVLDLYKAIDEMHKIYG